MDCKTARLLLDFVRPHASDLEAAEGEKLDEHLVECSDCRALAQNERRLDDHLGQAVRAVAIPQGLDSRILRRLRQERAAWYRRRLLAPAGLVAAAVVVLAVWLGFGQRKSLPGVDLHEVYEAVNFRSSEPSLVEDWFRETYRVQTAVPPQMNFTLLAFYDLAEFQGQRVPFLLFIRGGATARVYILSDKQFDLTRVEKPQGYSVEVLDHPTNPHFKYVVLVNPPDQFEQFLTSRQEQAA
jgi:hypothetical protein